ncbi:hypothetical protein [Algoriphagus hitonicola]|uniref:Uncharacterized protein n=1 Tax=Algoriphagus hitonicola TaxID=435880 RepID=A0A1I2TN86_9BACT|nr:hypothetical protein [Algoriphagus hitonicola]SFG66435.1 hypothetical protein SAMN04487988_106124 [Algoriphagus hitonicola]
MNEIPDIKTKPKVKIDEQLLRKSKVQIETEKQVVVHIRLQVDELPSLIRIWPNTFLICGNTNSKSKLLNADRISFAPMWTQIDKKTYRFTLIFEGLPKDCTFFDLVEELDTLDRFEYYGIARNQSDIYHLDLIP